jgi:hypothetical protein
LGDLEQYQDRSVATTRLQVGQVPLRHLRSLGNGATSHTPARAQDANPLAQTGKKRVSGIAFWIHHACTLMQFNQKMQNSALFFRVIAVGN